MAAITYNAPYSNGRKCFEIGMSAKFISKSLSQKSYRHAMLDLIVILLCLATSAGYLPQIQESRCGGQAAPQRIQPSITKFPLTR